MNKAFFVIAVLYCSITISCTNSRKSATVLLSQPSSIILDHIYVMVPNKGGDAIKLMEALGFVVNPRVYHITGEGKSSRTILFHNFYFEILWADDSVVSYSAEQLERSKRRTWYSGNIMSPFGVAFRRAPGVGDSIPIPNKATNTEPPGSWAKEGSFFNLITDDDDTMSTYLFVVPSYMGVDQWVQASKSKFPELFTHRNGVKALTRAVLYSVQEAVPAKVKYVSNIPMLKFEKAKENYAEFEFDNGKQKQSKDLRPALPLVLKW